VTILGQHTAHELTDLLDAYDYQLGQLDAAGQRVSATWMAADDAGYLGWIADLASFKARYVPVAAKGRASAAACLLQDTGLVEDDWIACTVAFSPLNALDLRMRQAPAAVAAQAPTYPANPQPTAPDADLGAFKAADVATRGIDAAVKAAGSSLMPSTKTLVIAGVCAALGLGLVLKVAK
jgi:hypothetical protein